MAKPTGGNRYTKYQAKAKRLAQSGISSRYIALKKMLEKVLDVPANTIGKREAERFADVCADTLQSDTAKARIWLLVSCWDWAKGKYHVEEENPFRGLSDRFRSQPKKPKRPFSVTEVRAILNGFRPPLGVRLRVRVDTMLTMPTMQLFFWVWARAQGKRQACCGKM